MTTIHSLKFGIEIETIVKGPESYEDGHYNVIWEGIVGPLSGALKRAGVANHYTMTDLANPAIKEYSEWCLKQESSLIDFGKVEPVAKWGVELISPIFDYANRDHWIGELQEVFKVLRQKAFDGKPSDACATQVHVSINPAWTDEQVKQLAQAVIRHRPGFRRLAWTPAINRGEFARPNGAGIVGVGGDEADFIRDLGRKPTVRDVVAAMCPSPCVTIRPRYYHWNFWPLVGEQVKKTDTVEYRLASGSASCDEAVMWIDFANLFVLAATQYPGLHDGPVEEKPEALGHFVVARGVQLGLPKRALDRLRNLLGLGL
ncbi:hypothetical protein F4779DRAFT_619064 [Xylariaceae sp. FL0662B]|nr:hypothetical protein F4779DRAFT_619064 [Xylariaceae sp. FL0662B]